MPRQLAQFRIIADKQHRERTGEHLRKHRHADTEYTDNRHALAEQIAQFCPVLCTVVIADNRRTADGEPEKYRDKDKVDIHDDAVGGDTVRTDQPDELEVVQDIDNRHGEIGHQLRDTVGAGAAERTEIQTRTGQMQKAVVLP